MFIIWFIVLLLNALICTSFTLVFILFLLVFLLEKLKLKTGSWCFSNLPYITGAFKFKKDNTSKPRICLYQIVGDC